MAAQEILLEAFKQYGIQVLSVTGNHIKVQNNYEVEVEANGMYKLLDEGDIIAPFKDVNELCRYIVA